ncbi:hypothetical protein N7532_010902 [Penicillium argentinense]|uniref:Uncharacterized protein n=1 Tax=Penicillium argentinense TaxID=1131581 RepID=A0A9W9JYJ9_9EURO|nr:uncharacterized protein N7532_010902 [Penicillium argentinense]KAJ5086131.1 hypothetical protein N7532_010902 [Penicillium argentinense]
MRLPQRTASQPVKSRIARLLQCAVLRYVIFVATKPELSSSRPLPNAINHHPVPPRWDPPMNLCGCTRQPCCFSPPVCSRTRIRELLEEHGSFPSPIDCWAGSQPGVPVPLIAGAGAVGGARKANPQDLRVLDAALSMLRVTPPDPDRTSSAGGIERGVRWSSARAERPMAHTDHIGFMGCISPFALQLRRGQWMPSTQIGAASSRDDKKDKGNPGDRRSAGLP